MHLLLHGRGKVSKGIAKSKHATLCTALFTAAAILSLSSCSKFGRLPASEKGLTLVSFQSGNHGLLPDGVHSLVGPPQSGGVVIWGVNADSSKAFSLILANDTDPDADIRLPVGAWSFYAVGWDSGSYQMEGAARCGSVNTNIAGVSQNVAIALSQSSCTQGFFGPSLHNVGGQPNLLRFLRCNSLPGSYNGSLSCDGATVGDFDSYKVSIVEHALGPVGTVGSEKITSRCVHQTLSGSQSMTTSNLRVPVGLLNTASPIFVEVTGYSDASCTTGAVKFTFDEGLLNGNYGPAAGVRYDSSYSNVYLVHGPIPEPSGITLIAPGTNPGNMGQPIVNVAGLVSGDTVDLYVNDASCTGSIVATGVAGSGSLNLSPSSPLGSDGTYTFRAKRSNGLGASPCSTANYAYVLDTAGPTVTLSTLGTNPTNAASYTIDVLFSNGVSGLSEGDFNATNCSVNGGSINVISSSHYEITVTPNPNTTCVLYLPAASVTETAGNNNVVSNTLNIVHENVQPSVALTSSATNPFNASTFTVNIQFSEVVSSFVTGDVSVTNGTLTSLTDQGSGLWYAVVDPTDNANVTVDVAAGVAVDSAGNSNTAAPSAITRQHDVIAPTVSGVTSTDADGTYHVGQTISISITFGEAMLVTTGGGTPRLLLNNGDYANYTSTSGAVISFSYVVPLGPSHNIGDLDYASTGALDANGGTITDLASNTANLTLATPNTSGSLSFTRSIGVSGTYLLTVAPTYASGSNHQWNRYIKWASSTDPIYLQPSETTCDPNSDNGFYGEYNGCIHAGELRKAYLPGHSTCANITASDALGVFDWVCHNASGTITIYSKGLKKTKGLRDLISTSAFFSNTLYVNNGGVPVGESNSNVWGWDNTIQQLPANGGGSVQVLTNAGNIYYVDSSTTTHGYEIGADRISVVTLGSYTLTYDEVTDYNFNAANCSTGSAVTSMIFCLNGFHHAWVETNLSGGSGGNKARMAVRVSNSNYNRVHRTQLNNLRQATAVGASLKLISSSYNFVSELASGNTPGDGGLLLNSSLKNRFEGLRFAGNSVGGANGSFIQIENASTNNRFDQLFLTDLQQPTASAITAAVRITDGSYNSFHDVLITNLKAGASSISTTGFYLGASAHHNIITQATVMNSDDAGIFIDGGDNNVVNHFTATNATWNGIYFKSAATNANFLHSLAFANVGSGIETGSPFSQGSGVNVVKNISASDSDYAVKLTLGSSGAISVLGFLATNSICTNPGGVDAELDGSCDRPGLSLSHINASLSGAWLGKVTANDTMNGSDTSGTVAYNFLTDLASFQNPWRGWGIDGSAFPNADQRGACTGTTTCRIWDMRIGSGSNLKDVGMAFNSTNPSFTAGLGCPTGVNGNDYETAAGFTFLRHADEINSDDKGNNNGLCESNEVCIYAPNVGAYQGEGALTAPCTFTNGTVTDVSLLRYTSIFGSL